MKLVSILLITYNNSKFIYEALDSIFMQDYGNIELIVSDDGSASYDLQSIKEYIQQNKGDNINSVIYNVNPSNIGTCRHVEKLSKLCTGDIIAIIAADDALYDYHVLSDIVEHFVEQPETDVVCCNLGMYDENLEKIDCLFVAPKDIELVNSRNNRKLFGKLACQCLLPALGTFYSRKAFDFIMADNKLSNYNIVEDWTSHIILAREGFRFYFIDRIAGKHRFGGVSHNNTSGYSSAEIAYYRDITNAFQIEVEPYQHLLDRSDYIIAEAYFAHRKKMYDAASNFAVRKAFYSKFQNATISEQNKAHSTSNLDFPRKHLIIAVDDATVLGAKLNSIFTSCSSDMEYVFALNDHRYLNYWKSRLIDETNNYRNKTLDLHVSIICNDQELPLEQFLYRIVQNIGDKCAIVSPYVFNFSSHTIKSLFDKSAALSIEQQINDAIPARTPPLAAATKSRFGSIVKPLIKSFFETKFSYYAVVGALFLILCHYIEESDAIIYANQLVTVLFVLSALSFIAFSLLLVYSGLSIFILFFKATKKVDYGRSYVNKYITFHSAGLLLVAGLFMLIAWEIFVPCDSLQHISVLIQETVDNLYFVGTYVLLGLSAFTVVSRTIYRTYKLIRYRE